MHKITITLVASIAAITLSCGLNGSGPSDDQIKKALPSFVSNAAFDPSKTEIIRGDVLEATGGRLVPAGTLLYPVKLKCGSREKELIFYQTSYREWQVQDKGTFEAMNSGPVY